MRRINFRTDQPYVVDALGTDPIGRIYLVPVGVTMAAALDEAREMAILRWPTYTLADPILWEKAEPAHRLAALRADRQIFP